MPRGSRTSKRRPDLAGYKAPVFSHYWLLWQRVKFLMRNKLIGAHYRGKTRSCSFVSYHGEHHVFEIQEEKHAPGLTGTFSWSWHVQGSLALPCSGTKADAEVVFRWQACPKHGDMMVTWPWEEEDGRGHATTQGTPYGHPAGGQRGPRCSALSRVPAVLSGQWVAAHLEQTLPFSCPSQVPTFHTVTPWRKHRGDFPLSLPRTHLRTPSAAAPTPTHSHSPAPAGNLLSFTWKLMLVFFSYRWQPRSDLPAVRQTTPHFLPPPTLSLCSQIWLKTNSFIPSGIFPCWEHVGCRGCSSPSTRCLHTTACTRQGPARAHLVMPRPLPCPTTGFPRGTAEDFFTTEVISQCQSKSIQISPSPSLLLHFSFLHRRLQGEKSASKNPSKGLL